MPHSINHGDACFAYVNKIWGIPRYVDRLLKGTKVSELPFQDPTEFKFAINLRTARAMKIVVPPAMLARADEVIE